MSDRMPDDPEIAALAAQLAAHRPRPSRTLHRRVRDVLTTGLRERALRRQAVWLVASGSTMIVVAALLAAVAAP